MAAPLIALLTDFGTKDWYVGCLKGVLLTICPGARVVDISHDIPPQDVPAGALTLAAATPWFPRGTIFVCVVDPGVGTARRILAAQADGRTFVGPDNGLLAPVLDRAARRALVRVTNRRYWHPSVSATFQGRDIMAPVAAHLARGRSLSQLGSPVRTYQALDLPSPRRTRQGLAGRVAHLDHFGGLITNLPAGLIGATARVRYRSRPVRLVSSYADGKPGELVSLKGSAGYLELAVRNGSAARRYRGRRGDRVQVLL